MTFELGMEPYKVGDRVSPTDHLLENSEQARISFKRGVVYIVDEFPYPLEEPGYAYLRFADTSDYQGRVPSKHGTPRRWRLTSEFWTSIDD